VNNTIQHNINQLIIKKIKTYCAAKERCIDDVVRKLKTLGCKQNEIHEIVNQLSKENFINEERFASIFAQNKFKLNKWGKIKIIKTLKSKNINEKIITNAIETINNEEYETMLIKIIQNRIKAKNIDPNKYNELQIQKIANYALQKGFEEELIFKILNSIFI